LIGGKAYDYLNLSHVQTFHVS